MRGGQSSGADSLLLKDNFPLFQAFFCICNEAADLPSLRKVGFFSIEWCLAYRFVNMLAVLQREQYQFLKRILRKGGVLYIHSLDRCGRNKEEIVQEWNAITKEIEADNGYRNCLS